MNEFVKDGLIFVAGAAVGAAIVYFIEKKEWAKYEILEVPVPEGAEKSDYGDLNPPPSMEEPKKEEDKKEVAEDAAKKYTTGISYASDTREINDIQGKDSFRNIDPHEIEPDEYCMETDSRGVGLIYTSDGVLLDDCEIPMDAAIAERMLGRGILDILKETARKSYEDLGILSDPVYYRNDNINVDFEVVFYEQSCAEITGYTVDVFDDLDPRTGHGSWENTGYENHEETWTDDDGNLIEDEED